MVATALDTPELWRPLWVGALCLALPMLLYTLLYPVIDSGALLFLILFPTLIPGTGAALVYSGGSFVRILVGALVMLAAAFAAMIVTEARIFGPISTSPLEAWPAEVIAAAFEHDAVAPNLALRRTVSAAHTALASDARGQTRTPVTRRGTFTITPITPVGATPSIVYAVALVEHDRETTPPEAPARGVLLRLLRDELHTEAVRRALVEAGVAPADRLVIGRWVEGRVQARLDAARPLLVTFGIAWLIWALLVLHRRYVG